VFIALLHSLCVYTISSQGISAADAIYLPAMETALSLVQDANAVIGESVAVYGQGMIG
jgi:threonine dehydrogenase-like Zn-dependent dehydrogenase